MTSGHCAEANPQVCCCHVAGPLSTAASISSSWLIQVMGGGEGSNH